MDENKFFDYFVNNIVYKDKCSYSNIYQYFKNIPNSESILKCCQIFLNFSKTNKDEEYGENIIKIMCLIQDIVSEIQHHSTQSK